MSEADVKIILERLGVITQLLAVSVIQGRSQSEQIPILDKAGFQPKDIAELIGTTPNAVRVFLSRQRRRKQ